jgi:hypothetical protein
MTWLEGVKGVIAKENKIPWGLEVFEFLTWFLFLWEFKLWINLAETWFLYSVPSVPHFSAISYPSPHQSETKRHSNFCFRKLEQKWVLNILQNAIKKQYSQWLGV